ncbi:Zinc finger protein [Pseudolycoriella hygida]|uniref:Zinc finger protein n=1 Tax=Pseudolycoriella hygida TaxID=35572 RepID=A0A9Q0MJ17_9DIPT|nr:Zinc finger protein [Pseudolycoriella hygida]
MASKCQNLFSLSFSQINKNTQLQIFVMSDLEEESLFPTMCRLCLSENVELIRLYPKDDSQENASTGNIFEIVERFTTVKIARNDKLPQKICESCTQMLASMLAYQNKCKRSNEQLHRMMKMECLDEQPATDIKFVDVEHINESVLELHHEGDDETNVKTNKLEANQRTTNESQQRLETNAFSVTKSSPEKFACEICGKLYIKGHLRHHMNSHVESRPFKCDVAECVTTFKCSRDLSNHKRICHFLKSNLSCDICGRKFKLRSTLVIHKTTHFDPQIPCKVCNKKFRNTRSMSKHMLVHSQLRKFKCEICDKSFQTRYTLRVHKRVHNGEKPYQCHCGVSFAYKCLLKTHEEKYHSCES